MTPAAPGRNAKAPQATQAGSLCHPNPTEDLMAAWIDIFPKTHLVGTFAQSTFQATDTATFKTGTLQVWVDGLLAGDSVSVVVQDADFNEERDFAASDNPSLAFSSDGSQLLRVSLPRRFARLQVVPTLGTAEGINVRAELTLMG